MLRPWRSRLRCRLAALAPPSSSNRVAASGATSSRCTFTLATLSWASAASRASGFRGEPRIGYGGEPRIGYGGEPRIGYGGEPRIGYGGEPRIGYGGEPRIGYGGQLRVGHAVDFRCGGRGDCLGGVEHGGLRDVAVEASSPSCFWYSGSSVGRSASAWLQLRSRERSSAIPSSTTEAGIPATTAWMNSCNDACCTVGTGAAS